MPLRRAGPLLAAAAVFALAAAGCGGTAPDAVTEAALGECSGCHGGADGPAPPRSTKGTTSPGDVRVGAHRAHLGPGPFRKPVACGECHVVPATVDAPGHADKDRADVVFAPLGLARARGAAPAWDGARCASTYCHGATLDGGVNPAPLWTTVDGSQARCGSCHGAPPALAGRPRVPHPAVSGPVPATCAACHPGTVLPDGTIAVGGGRHVDGEVQIGGAACAGCHGDPDRLPAAIAPAPPRDVAGRTATTALGVGAHQRHLAGTALRATPVACGECHDVADGLAHHPDGAVEVSWGPLAKAGGVVPAWSRAVATCVTYCHGATLRGGTATAPVWTKVDGTQVGCTSCHGVPPPAPHVQDQDCGRCHLGFTATTVARDLHVDGYVEVELKTCVSCHGSADRTPELQPAPPTDLSGDTSPGALGVGAHQAHLTGTSLARPVACGECHPRITSTAHAAGKGLVRQVVFGPLASTGGAFPAWERVAATCTSTYCHGATLAGGQQTAPVWTRVDGIQKRCDACHGVPPPAPHPARQDCDTCHPGFTATSVVAATHVDGVVDAGAVRCTSCHGDAARLPATAAPAPPQDTKGGFATSGRGVGAHQRHLADGALRRAVACAECHEVPAVMNHADAAATVTFGPLAVTSTVSASWDGARCSGVYCHGAGLGGGTQKAPLWTTVDGTQAACGTCHGVPPPAPHPQTRACGGCHPGYTSTSVDPARHVDGEVQASATCTSCHGDPAAAPAIAAAPPRDTQGNTATSARGVGAHRAHLAGGPLRPGLACTECHLPTNAATHPEGALTVTFGPLAAAAGASPAWKPATLTCAAVYCHGATLAGGTDPEPAWTRATGLACDACHGIPPPAPHVRSALCGACHRGYTSASVDPALHVDGVVDATGGTCTSCHGDAARGGPGASAPPRDTAGNVATGARGVGAHQRHLEGGLLRPGVPCAECHPPTSTATHPEGTLAVTFGALAAAGGANPGWRPATATCASTYCHGATLSGGTLQAPAWTTVNGTQAACGTCHGVPPPAPHVQSAQCGACHLGYTSTTVDPAVHVDGVVDATAGTCTSCHGDGTRSGPGASAPPRDTAGNTATSSRGVGAHQRHLDGGPLRAGVGCTECHPAPGPVHPGSGLELVFGALAGTGTAASWNGTARTCSNYCHGATLGGGTLKAPVWTTVNGTQAACGTCHGTPPPAPHVQSGSCGACHPGYTATTVDPAIHVDGVLDATGGGCTSCHGDATRSGPGASAPPRDTAGNTATSFRGVGAHQRHLDGGPLRAGIACTECHPSPGAVHPGGGLELAFGPLARTGTAASWNATARTCANYCHGATLGGGSLRAPVWTTVNGTQAACGTCHGVPPPKPHVQRTSCGACHPGSGATTVDAATHVDGTVQAIALTCTTCHGDPSRTLVTGADARARAAPPADTTGASAATLRSVGAHLAHLNRGTGAIAAPTACSECHVVPSSSLHADGAVNVTFGARARTGGAAPTWNGTACANTYCHGKHANGLAAAPSWTATGPLGCSTGCHPRVPNNSNHTTFRHDASGGACNGCHKDTDATGSRITNPALHVNGRVDGVCADCH